MVQKKLIPLLGLTALFLLSCQPGKEKKETIISEVICQPVAKDDYLLGAPNALMLSDSILAIVDTQSDSLIHFFNIKKKEYIRKAGLRGQGPEEFTMITSLSSCGRGSFSLYDPNKRRLYYVNKTADDSFIFTPSFHIDSLILFNVLPVSGQQFLATGINENQRYYLLNQKGQIKSTFGEWPYRDEVEKNVSGRIKSQAYTGGITVSPSGTKFLSFAIGADILSFYQLKNGVAHLVKESCFTYPDYAYKNNPKSFRGTSKDAPLTYLSATCTEKYVYILYSGKDSRKNGLNAFMGNMIHVYSWTGNKIAELKSDKNLQCLCMSQDENLMYAIAYTPEPALVQLHLPQL